MIYPRDGTALLERARDDDERTDRHGSGRRKSRWSSSLAILGE
jgi:hypothetical protein